MKNYLLAIFILISQSPLFGCGFFSSCFEWEYKPPKIFDFYFAHTFPFYSTLDRVYGGISEINVGAILHLDGKSSNKSTANSILIYLTGGYRALPIAFNANNPFGYRTGELAKVSPWWLDYYLHPLVSLNIEGRLSLVSEDKVKIIGFIKALFGNSYGNYTNDYSKEPDIRRIDSRYYLLYDIEYHPEVQIGVIFEDTNHNDVRLGIKLNSLDALSLEFIHRY